MHRRQQDKQHKKSERASKMTEKALHRQKQDTLRKESKRNRVVPVECTISAFHSDIKIGPDFVCTCCHRMMY